MLGYLHVGQGGESIIRRRKFLPWIVLLSRKINFEGMRDPEDCTFAWKSVHVHRRRVDVQVGIYDIDE